MIVGGTGGIGSQIVRRLASSGCDIALVYRSAEKQAQQLDQEIEGLGRKCLLLKADVADNDQATAVVEKTVSTFGQLDVLVSTQGWLHELKLFHEDSLDNFRTTINIELWSVIYLAKAVIPHMIKQGGGRIVTLGSDSGKAGSTAEAVSAAARGAVIALSKSLARELSRHKITVNCVCPGPTDTALLQEMLKGEDLTGKLMRAMIKATPMRRAAMVEEVASVVVFLAGEDASFVTGQAVSVSGGLTMS
jgi:NAD(P)-dependent dehydrogenase (short-subunit alcohol dehydrogenase family)